MCVSVCARTCVMRMIRRGVGGGREKKKAVEREMTGKGGRREAFAGIPLNNSIPSLPPAPRPRSENHAHTRVKKKKIKKILARGHRDPGAVYLNLQPGGGLGIFLFVLGSRQMDARVAALWLVKTGRV